MRWLLTLLTAFGFLGFADRDAWGANDVATAIERVKALGGSLAYDAAKNIVGVDLLECSATDADVELLTALAGLREISLWARKSPTKESPGSTRFPN